MFSLFTVFSIHGGWAFLEPVHVQILSTNFSLQDTKREILLIAKAERLGILVSLRCGSEVWADSCLVLYEGQERTDNKGAPFAENCWQLIAQAFPSARGHQA